MSLARMGAFLGVLLGPSLGCGGATTAPHDAPRDEAIPHAVTPTPVTAVASAPSPGAVAAPPSIVTLAGLLTKSSHGFPAAAEREATCSFAVGLVGEVADDYQDLSKHCGAGIGMKAYTESASGKLDAGGHRGDTYDLHMLGGLCYRLLVVGDPTLLEMKLRIEHPDGAVNVMAETKEGVLIVDPKQAWCQTEDREFHVLIEASGRSAGAYAFGVWARPAR